MKEFFKNLRSDKVLFAGFLVSFVFFLISLVYAIISYPRLPFFIPLFNQLPWGMARLGEKQQIFIPLALSALVFITNWFLSLGFYGKIPLLSRLFSLTTVLISFLTFVFILRTIQLIL